MAHMKDANIIFSVPLPEEVVSYIQMLDYELKGFQTIIEHLLRQRVRSEAFAQYQALYREKNLEYRLALASIEDEYIPFDLEPDQSFSVHFRRKGLFVYEN